MKYYKGKFRPKNLNKYKGDINNIIYRSHWEKQVFKWCDEQTDIVAWASESVIVPYRCKTDNRMHRYFPDIYIKFKDGKICLVEIKPKKETKEPKKRKKTKRYINEVMTYIKNQSKWEAATDFANDRGWEFQVWTEDTIKGLGIKLLT
jgi:hypothetical protein